MNERVLSVVRHFAEAEKPIASICHGAQVLAAAGVIAGKCCNCYPAVAPEVRAAGAVYAELPWEGALVDGKLVTAPAWTAHPEWLRKFLELLGSRIEP